MPIIFGSRATACRIASGIDRETARKSKRPPLSTRASRLAPIALCGRDAGRRAENRADSATVVELV